ncbi:lysoplasmalogenase family protein [Kordia jejudonensis]|uniref:lysoplasmalogenase family protein n=1 Tax=Kordia jejudonensis TaxID=1348245 RepID=UPI000629CF64|nr:lysoplasmalogenase family protein [Kordia jejudonensis]
MPKQKILLVLYFIVLALDAIGVVFPEWIDRKYTTFLPIPLLLILYVYTVKKMNWLYVTSLIFTMIAIIFFNMPSYFKLALVFYGIGLCFYVIIVLKKAVVIPVKTIVIATIPFLIVYLVPLFFYSDAVQTEIFNYIMFYVFFVGLFFFISTLVYINKPSKTNLWLLCSGILFLISTIIHGYNLFFEYVTTIRVGVVITFLIMHFAMYKYVSKQ